jgi:hypothetical protein
MYFYLREIFHSRELKTVGGMRRKRKGFLNVKPLFICTVTKDPTTTTTMKP